MVQIGFSRCLVWFILASVYFPSSFELSARISDSEKYTRHDKNWWFWNQEAKEKMGTFEDTQKKEDKDIKVEFKRSVHPFTPDVGLLRSLLSKEPLNGHRNKKRWLSGSFGRKNQHKQSGKWLIDSQLSGSNVLPNTPVIQDQWTTPQQKVTQIQQEDKTDIPLRKFSAGSKDKSLRKHKMHPKKISLPHQRATNEHQALKVNNMFRSLNHAYNKENQLGSGSFQQELTEQRPLTYGNQGPYSVHRQVWNKSHDPVYDRFMTPFGELKDNPLRHPYPFHDSRSSIKWYTTLNHGLIRMSEPPCKEQDIQNNQFHSSVENENGDYYEIMESKGVGKSVDKKAKELTEQRHREYELIPKIYALNQLRNGKRGYKKYKNNYGWPTDSFSNPIIVPGFKRKQSDDAQQQPSDDKQVILRPNIIRTEERKSPFEEEFIQVSRANRNQTRNILGMNDNRQVTPSGVHNQMPSPYVFPGGVNISILVPNPPALSPYETQALSTMTSTSTDKNNKKKKERKKKVKNYDELRENLLSEPRSLASAHANIRKFPYTEKTGINPLTGNDDSKMREMNLINYRPQLANAKEYIKQPMFDLKSENFSILNHIRNLTMDQLDWDTPFFGIQTENVNKPADYSEDDDDDDEIRMLYDEQTSTTTTLGSDKKQQTVSFSWYRLNEHFPRIFSTQDSWGNGKLSTPPNIKRLPGFELGGSGMDASSLEYVTSHTNYTCMEIERPFKRSARDEMRSDDHEDGRIKPYDHGIRHNMVKHENKNLDDNDPNVMPSDQWDALDEDLISEASANSEDVAWQAKNRKRETDYYDYQGNDKQGYYRLSAGGNSFRNPTNLIMSVLRGKPDKPRERDYYEDTPEERIREQMRPKYEVPSNYPK